MMERLMTAASSPGTEVIPILLTYDYSDFVISIFAISCA
jgi:hypothetical protein